MQSPPSQLCILFQLTHLRHHPRLGNHHQQLCLNHTTNSPQSPSGSVTPSVTSLFFQPTHLHHRSSSVLHQQLCISIQPSSPPSLLVGNPTTLGTDILRLNPITSISYNGTAYTDTGTLSEQCFDFNSCYRHY